MNKGSWYAIGAYAIWGLFPLYWKWLHLVSPLQLLSHRILWSFLILFPVLLFLRQWKDFRSVALTRRVVPVYLTAALILALNWLTYVWAVNAGYVVESSLGYFISPLLSVLIGVLILREHLRVWQWVPIGIAAAGVAYLTVAVGSLPWIGLTLAVTFSLYGLVKKTAPLSSSFGVTLETGLLSLPVFLYLLFAELTGQGAFLHQGIVSDVLLVGGGLVTTIPLLLFASAAQRIPMTLVGILQYISPTLQFLLGVVVYKEPFTRDQFIGYGIVWLALVFFAVEGFLTHRAQTVAAIAE